jgi:hypothetical protein
MSDDFFISAEGSRATKNSSCQRIIFSINRIGIPTISTFNYFSTHISIHCPNLGEFECHGMRTKVVLNEFLLLFLPNVIHSPTF